MAIENNTQNITSLLINGTELSSTLNEFKARQDALASALSSAAGDYNTEIIDARADAFGNNHDLVGNNIRVNQNYLLGIILEKFEIMQSQYDELAAAYIKLSDAIINLTEKESNT